MTQEKILCAAIFVETRKADPPRRSFTYPATGLMFCGWRHGDCFTTLNVWKKGLWWWERWRLRKFAEGNLDGRFQGFLTSTGRFVNRGEAAEIAIAAEQVEASSLRGLSLYSEDLY